MEGFALGYKKKTVTNSEHYVQKKLGKEQKMEGGCAQMVERGSICANINIYFVIF